MVEALRHIRKPGLFGDRQEAVGEQRRGLVNREVVAHALTSFYISLATRHIDWPETDNPDRQIHNPVGNPVFRSFYNRNLDQLKVGVRSKTIDVRDTWLPLKKETVRVFKGVARRTEPEMSKESFLSLYFVLDRQGLLVPVMGEIFEYNGFLVVPELMHRDDWHQSVMKVNKVRAAFPEEAPVKDNVNEDTWREKCTPVDVPPGVSIRLGDRHYSVLLMGRPKGMV